MNNLPYKVDPTTNIENVIYFKNFRVSILKNNLIRIEKSNSNTFNDDATQLALFRNFKKVYFTYEINENELVVYLSNYTLYFSGILENSYIYYKNKKLYLNNDYNLGGTYGTVDGMDGDKIITAGGNRSIGYGVCSTNGVAIIDDSDSYCFDDELNFYKKNINEEDVYIFFYPNKYKEAVKALFELSGFPPKLPKHIFGNWWSRFYAYTQQKYLYLMDYFINEDIPITVATVDMDWHYSSDNGRNIFEDLEMDESEFIKNPDDENEKYFCYRWKDSDPWSKGWTGWTWNKKLFPDYKKFLNELHQKGLQVTLNIHPAQGILFFDAMYEKCADLLNIDPKSKENVPFDLTDLNNREVWFKEVFNKYEHEGVDFWWIDWQQGDNSKFPGLTPMWLCNHYFMLDGFKNKNRPLILSRFCGIGGHRYPLGFSGDSFQTFDSLKYLVKTTSQASNVGFTYWSHDVGGHMNGYKDGDLYLKFVQFAVFSPILRLHSSAEEMYSKEPDLFLKGNGELIKKYLRLRHKMIPYIYSFSLKTSKEGTALIEPLFYQNPYDKKAYKYKDTQYYFASDLIVAPYCNKKDNNDLNKIKVYFPKYNYYDYKYGYMYSNNKVVSIIREQGDMPVFIKEGSFFLLDSNNHSNNITNPISIDLITTFGNGSYIFNEDDGNKLVLKTKFVNKVIDNNNGQITIKINGSKLVYQNNRKYNFKLLNVFNINNIEIINASISNVTVEGGCLQFSVENVKYNEEVTITYSFNNLTNIEKIKYQVKKRLSYVDDDNRVRQRLYSNILNANNLETIIKLIKESTLLKHNIEILLEMTNIKL